MVINRLTGDRNFQYLYRRGQRARGQVVNLNYIKVKDPLTKVAVVVSKKVSPLATKRNLYKRRIWASLRAQRHLLPAPGHYLAVIAQVKIKDFNYQELNKEIGSLLKKII